MFAREHIFLATSVLLASACFTDTGQGTETSASTTTDTGDTGMEESTDTGSSETADSTGETSDCADVGCSCEDVTDCSDDLACVDGVCGPVAVCGDQLREASEQCDDGNSVDGDGCDNDCTFTELLAVDTG